MLTPEDLEKIESKVKIKLSFINLYVTGRVIQEMERTFKELSGASAAFTTKEMKSAAKLMEDIRSEVKKQSPKIDKEIRQAFYDAAGKINYENEQFLDDLKKYKVQSRFFKAGLLPLPIDSLNIPYCFVRLMQ